MAAPCWDEGRGVGVLRQAEIRLGSELLLAGVCCVYTGRVGSSNKSLS